MQITSLEQQKRNEDNVNVFLDGKYWLSLSKNQVLSYGIRKGTEVDDELKQTLELASAENKLREKVYRYVTARPRSAREVLIYLLQRRQLDKESATKVVADLQSTGLVSDTEFVKFYFKGHIRKDGLNKIKAGLRAKGVDKQTIDTTLAELMQEEEHQETLNTGMQRMIDKLSKGIKAKDQYEFKQKLTQKLLRRGYDYREFKELI
jgi:regulatory protein